MRALTESSSILSAAGAWQGTVFDPEIFLQAKGHDQLPL